MLRVQVVGFGARIFFRSLAVQSSITGIHTVYVAAKLLPIDNIKRRLALDTKNAPGSTYIYFSCPDNTQNECGVQQKTAYTFNSNGFFWVSWPTHGNSRVTNGTYIADKSLISSKSDALLFSHP